MKITNTTIRLYINKVWSDPITITDFIRRHKDNTQIEAVYITEAFTRKEAIKVLQDLIKK